MSGDPVTAAVYVAEDGGEAKSRDYELPLVQNAAQAAQLAAYELTNSREFITATLIVGPEFLAARVGEAIMVDLPSFAISNLKCIISGREFDPSGQVVALSVKSETDAKHDFALGRTDVAPASTALVRFDPTLPDGPELESWGVSTATLDNEQGVKLPALRIVGAVDDPNAAAILIDYREVGAVDWIDAGVYDRKSTTIDILGIKPSTAYEVRIRYKMVGGIISPARIYTAESGNFALQALDDAASDGILDPTEKKSVKRNYEELQAGRANLLASAAALNIPTTNYTNALDALTTYLTGLSPAWDDVSKATPIDRAAFLSRFSNAYSARELLNKAIAAETARRANYSQVTDDQGTKPEDNATVGAPAGTYVAGQLSEEVVAQIAQLEAARDALDLEIEDLIADIETTKGRVTAARTDLDQARADLDAEIARAVDSEDAIRTTVTTAQGRADQAYTAFETEKTQRVGADIALGLRIDTTVSSITTEKAALNSRITSEVATLVGADQAITNTIDAAKTEYRGLAADNASAIETEKTTRTTAIGSLAGTVSNLTTSFNGARADIDNLVIDNANRRAEIIQTNSRITIENLALSNADEALTNSLNSAKSEYRGLAADNASAIQTEKTTRTTALQSVASTFTAIDAKFAGTAASGLKTDLNARITNEAAVLAEADRVAAQTVSNLSSSVNGLSSTVNNQAGTIAKVDGRTSAYMTSTINAGDNTAEFQLFADNKAGSSAKLIADQIALQNGSKVALRVVGGDVHIFGKLQVPTLSAITANIGTLRTASTGQRTEITNDGITVFNAAGIAVVQLGIF